MRWMLWMGFGLGAGCSGDEDLAESPGEPDDTEVPGHVDDGPVEVAEGSFLLTVTGTNAACAVAWEAAPTGVSYTCPDCTFTLEWAFDVNYAEATTEVGGCDYDEYYDYRVLMTVMYAEYALDSIQSSSHVWGWSDGHPTYGSAAVLGYADGASISAADMLFLEGDWDPVTGDFAFVNDVGHTHGTGTVR